jgi:hypothetical protein
MSKIDLNKKHNPEDVIPYLFDLFYNQIPIVSKPIKMYLVGSRGRTEFKDWEKLYGKDWDLLIEFTHYIRNPRKIIDISYNIDILRCDKKEIIEKMLTNNYTGDSGGFELFPNTPEFLKKYIK